MIDEAVGEARTLGDRRLEIRAELERWQMRNQSDPGFSVEEMEAFARRAVAELEELDDDEGLAHAWLLVSNGPWSRARWSQTRDPLRRAIEHARRAGDAQQEEWLEAWLATTLFWGETPTQEGIPVLRDLLERSRGSLSSETSAHRILAAFLGLVGEFDEAREHIARARQISDELGPIRQLAGGDRAGSLARVESGAGASRTGPADQPFCRQAFARRHARGRRARDGQPRQE